MPQPTTFGWSTFPKQRQEHGKRIWQPRERTPEAQALIETIGDIAEHPAYRQIAGYLRAGHLLGLDIKEPAVIEKAIAAGAADHEAQVRHAYQSLNVGQYDRHTRRHRHNPLVYYIRNGRMVKIGTTTNLATRATQVGGQGILAIEPGGEPEEHGRHRQFSHLRHHLEWFILDEDLGQHIGELRDRFLEVVGCDTEEWVEAQAAFLPRNSPQFAPIVGRLAPDGPVIQDWQKDEYVTAAEIARIKGITTQAVSLWRKKGKVRVVARDGRGRALYNLAEALAAPVGKARTVGTSGVFDPPS